MKIEQIAKNSYHEYGKVGYAELNSGRFVAESGSDVKAIVAKSNDAAVENKDLEKGIRSAYTTVDGASFSGVQPGKVNNADLPDIQHDAEAEFLSKYIVNGSYYLSLTDIIERVPAIQGVGYNFTEGEYNIEVLKDVDDMGFDVGSNAKVNINLNGHTYNINSTVGSAGTTTNGIHPTKENSEITIRNGTIKSSVGKMIVNAYGKFKAENVKFDCSQMSLSHYGDNEFTGSNAIYNGLECCIFVCNDNGANRCNMELKDCEILMPSSSNKGVSVDGDLTLNNTRVDGYLSVNRGGVLKIGGSTMCTKTIQTYFEGDTLESAQEGEYTVYRNTTVA